MPGHFFCKQILTESGNNPEEISVWFSNAALPHDFFVQNLF